MTEEDLDGADVITVFKEMSRKRMAKRMAAGGLGDSRGSHRRTDGALDDALVQVASAPLARLSVHLRSTHLRRVPLAVKEDESTNPADVRLLGTNGILTFPNLGAELGRGDAAWQGVVSLLGLPHEEADQRCSSNSSLRFSFVRVRFQHGREDRSFSRYD